MVEKPLLFAFGLHNHQPVGNFDFIFEEAYRKAYLPFLEVLERHPGIRISQHFTGILLDWFEETHPEFVERVGRLVSEGRIELLGGGYYEPILPMLPPEDRVGQIEALSERLKRRFGRRPDGAWVAERVWEPGLAGLFARTGIKYVLLDDAHFKMAGLREQQLVGPFLTEDEGRTLAVFPISQELRYLIPFQPVEKSIEHLRGFSGSGEERVVVLADDGEKFGIWPYTHHSVYEEGWLEELLSALEEERSWLECVTYSEALERTPIKGVVYLPTASYSEMMDWALPAEEGAAIADFRKSLDEAGKERHGRFIKGGHWRFFLSKYREVLHMHRKMLAVSQALDSLPPRARARRAAQEHLYAAQCNCGYWHGVFGGIYLNHIRAENHHNLILAEEAIRANLKDSRTHACRRWDFFREGGDALEVTTPTERLLFDLAHGGALAAWYHLPKAWNLVNTMTRRPEAYHRELLQPRPESCSDGAEGGSIHDLHLTKETGLERFLVYDPYRRVGNIPHFFASEQRLEDLLANPAAGDSELIHSHYTGEFHNRKNGCSVRLHGSGNMEVTAGGLPVEVDQEWVRDGRTSAWTITTVVRGHPRRAWQGFLGLEYGWSLNAGHTHDRFYLIDGRKPVNPSLGGIGESEGVSGLSLVEGWWKLSVDFEFEIPARLWRFPIETVSSSEGGFERNYQSSVVIPAWRATLEPGSEFRVSFRLRVSDLSGKRQDE
ncbi:MAG: DUF1926 domain-containing protein [Candidatus Omnitrophica bacterium]|nr:DUF1926 domain-containing protein [Candidatus Omnitrophota bacterium]